MLKLKLALTPHECLDQVVVYVKRESWLSFAGSFHEVWKCAFGDEFFEATHNQPQHVPQSLLEVLQMVLVDNF